MNTKRAVLAAAAGLLWLTLNATAQAQSGTTQAFPTKPLRFVIGSSPGSAPDVRGRQMAPRLAELLGQPVVVDNRPGANGALAAQETARAAPDGHTFFMLTINNVLNALLGLDRVTQIERDFAMVTSVSAAPVILFVHPGMQAASLRAFLDQAQARPGGVSYVTGGTGSLDQLVGEWISMQSGVRLTDIAYKSATAGLSDVISGQVLAGFNYAVVVGAHFKSGRLRPLAVASRTRLAAVPDVPTFEEAGLPGIEAKGWQGIAVPAKTPRPAIDRLQRTIAQVINQPDLREQIISLGSELGGDAPEAFAALVKSELDKWGKVIRERGIKIE